MDLKYWWERAKTASEQVGWFPTVILAQWQHETGDFRSNNFVKNNNIAGQTWQNYMPEAIRGTARPAAEGGYYIRYDDPVTGYVDFIKNNGRYAGVKLKTTEEAQIRAIAAAGWAVDPNYADKLIRRLKDNEQLGFRLATEKEEEDMAKPMQLENDWQWKMLSDALDGLYKKGVLTDHQWAEKAYNHALSPTELAWLNLIVYARQNGINV
ncbi:glucosaminidase domain-containing protein [Paenibacillus roseipurpureus]|uniref:Glucosaminidase domain-containing protein n=1 Tax=Paenibacillus roseopurpureus TaxID=2918901 RepID=A0AA96LS31_9BACL|nr:glucosaminidase domain-containing protein [Paenibacillus sp. MBLB1832]WNR44878.1 glucosaminidase domain-containing protein [Paenibacillus sp. MBLB1832]